MAMGSLTGIVGKLREHGVPGDMPVAIVREGTKPTQETLVATLDTIVAEVERTQFKAPAIVVIGHVVAERESIRWFDNGPLFGKRVLVTRPREQTQEFVEALYEAGAQPVVAPTIAIGPPDDASAAIAVTSALSAYAWVVFTSQNGVQATFAHLASRGADARAFGTAKVAAVGPRTAASLAAHGIVADFVPATFSADDVASGLADRSNAGDRVLFLGAQEMRQAPVEALRANDRHVDVVAAYKTSAVADSAIAASARETDVWTFASASAVESFVANVTDAVTLANGKTIACIGSVTAAAATALGLHVDVVPHDFTVAGLLDALLDPVVA
jgi:uroporphyrinogen III methyltransferase/synthase